MLTRCGDRLYRLDAHCTLCPAIAPYDCENTRRPPLVDVMGEHRTMLGVRQNRHEVAQHARTLAKTTDDIVEKFKLYWTWNVHRIPLQ